MRNLLSSFLLVWLASINVGMSSPTQIADSSYTTGQPSTGRQDLEMTDSRPTSVQNYAPEGEMVIPRLRHRLRKDISTRLGTRGILFDKMERSRSRRRHGWQPPLFTESSFRYGRRDPYGLRPPYSPYDRRYGMEQYDELPNEFEAFLMDPFSPFYYQSSELNARPSPSYYQRPQSYNRPTVPAATQPSYYPGQFMQPQPVESVQARPYYRGQNLVSNRRPSREQPDQEFTFQPQQVGPAYYPGQALPSNGQPSPLSYNQPQQVGPAYYPGQALPSNGQLSPLSYNNPTQYAPTSAKQENRRQPVEPAFQRQPTGPGGYDDESNIQLLRPNVQGRPVPTSTKLLNGKQPLQSAFQQQQLQTRPNYRNESDVQSPELTTQGLGPLPSLPTSNPQLLKSTLQRQQSRPDIRDKSNVQPQAFNGVRQSAPMFVSRENSERAADSSRYQQQDEAVPDYGVNSNKLNTEAQPASTSRAEESRMPALKQDTILGFPQKMRAQSDQHDEIQSKNYATPPENQNHDKLFRDQLEANESKIG